MEKQFLFFAVLISIASCTSQKVTSQVDTSPVVPKTDKPVELVPVEKKPDLPVGPDTFDIGLILPFFLDSVSRIPDSVEVNYYDESTLAIEFYNGVKMAIDKLAPSGINLRLHVYDDLNDKDRIRKIADLPVFKKLDLLLGPVYNNNLRAMAAYAKRDSVYLVSPLSPAMNITSQNPHFIMVNPSIEVHCKRLFDYVVQRHSRSNILLLTRPGSEAEESYAEIFRKMLKQYHAEINDSSLQFVELPFTPKDDGDDLTAVDESFMKFFDVSQKNIVIVPSVDKAYNHSAARKLYSFIEPPKEIEDAVQYDITLLGLPAWGDQQELRLDYAERLNVHFTSSSYIPSSFYSDKDPFYKGYVTAYHTEPSEYAVKGYDLMLFFGNLFVKYGAPVDSMLLAERYTGIHTKFRFGVYTLAPAIGTLPVDSLPPPVEYIENKYVHLLKYEDGEVKTVD